MGATFEKLTRRALREVKRGERIVEKGIEFERMPDGDGRWTVNIMVDGQRIHRVVGTESAGVTRTQAEKFIEKVRTDARHDRLALPRGRKVALSFRDAADAYIKKLEETGGKQIGSKRSQLDLHLVPFFGSLPLSKITGFDIERYKKQRLSEVVQGGGDQRSKDRKPRTEGRLTKPATVDRELATLSHLFTIAVDSGWVVKKPKIKLLRESNGRTVYLSSEQVERLLEAARESDNAQLHAFCLIALQTSMRRMEVLSIRREHVHLEQRTIYIPDAKAGAREQPITAHLAEFLARYMVESIKADDEWLFPSSLSKCGHTTSIEKPFRAAVRAAGLDPKEVVRHTLRHTAITHAVQSGVDLPTVKAISGHKTLAMLERYTHQDSDHLRAAMDKLERRIVSTKPKAA